MFIMLVQEFNCVFHKDRTKIMIHMNMMMIQKNKESFLHYISTHKSIKKIIHY
jgi:hypothetical protein